MPRPTLLLLPWLLMLNYARPATAQATNQAPHLKGRVLDAKTRQPVPYATLWLLDEHNWALANAKGHFNLAAPEKFAADTLLAECPGYLPRLVVLRNRTLPDTTLTLEKVASTPKSPLPSSAQVEIRRLGSQAKKPGEGMIQGMAGSQFALLMDSSPKLTPGLIRNVSFFIAESGFPKDTFRIRIYRADGPNRSPGTNLLTENLLVAAPGGGQWFTVDIAKYLVEVPRDGFFVAMEWVFDLGFDDHGMMLSQFLRPTYEFKDSKTWNFTVGKGWNLVTLQTPQSKAYNAMMRAEIMVLK